MAGVEKTYKGLKELFLREKFHKESYRDLSLYMRQHSSTDISVFAERADKFLSPLDKMINGFASGTKRPRAAAYYANHERTGPRDINQRAHRPDMGGRRCFNCGMNGHFTRECTAQPFGRLAGNPSHRTQNVLRAHVRNRGLKSVLGRVNGRTVETLRDTGCTAVLIQKSLVPHEQLTGEYQYVQGFKGNAEPAPVAVIEIDTPYYCGTVEALCVTDLNGELIIGNIPGARNWDHPDPQWRAAADVNTCAVITRSKAQDRRQVKPLTVRGCPGINETISKESFQAAQNSDKSLDKFRDKSERPSGNNGHVKFIKKRDLLYRQFWNPNVNHGRPIQQLLVPNNLRVKIMEIAHDSIMGDIWE
ncbi:uncharacterized protein LOC144749273 [Ciona intestinalis]